MSKFSAYSLFLVSACIMGFGLFNSPEQLIRDSPYFYGFTAFMTMGFVNLKVNFLDKIF